MTGALQIEQTVTEILEGLKANQIELGIGGSKHIVQGSRENFEEIFNNMNRW